MISMELNMDSFVITNLSLRLHLAFVFSCGSIIGIGDYNIYMWFNSCEIVGIIHWDVLHLWRHLCSKLVPGCLMRHKTCSF